MERWEMRERESLRILHADVHDILHTLLGPGRYVPGEYGVPTKRKEKLTFAERQANARKANAARWKGRKPVYCRLEGHDQAEQGERECPRWLVVV